MLRLAAALLYRLRSVRAGLLEIKIFDRMHVGVSYHRTLIVSYDCYDAMSNTMFFDSQCIYALLIG